MTDSNCVQQESSDENAQSSNIPFEFRGNGMEYFKLWVVNILLTILTLGIYSAWATVRNRRYFYSNTYLSGDSFAYLAEPLQILKGRIIAVVVFALVSVLLSIRPDLSFLLIVLSLFVTPFIFNASKAFQLRNSAYKNIQFRFYGTYGEAFMVLVIWPLAALITLGILYPVAVKKLNEYTVSKSVYGDAKFEFNASIEEYYMIFIHLGGLGVLSFIFSLILGASVVLLAPFIYLGAFVYWYVATTNLFYTRSTLAEHGFRANITILGYTKVLLTNLLLIVLTLGLYHAAAKVRMTKYLCSCIEMKVDGSLDNFTAAEKENVSALGEQLGDVFDFAG
jgi:uncharacterized membrane protein YjgN (DUF898 family)